MNFGMKNSIILFLFLIPAFLFAQYPATGNKSRLGYQTTGDGLIWRGVAADTVTKPRTTANAYFQLDTVNRILRRYIATQGSWQVVAVTPDLSGYALISYVDSLYATDHDRDSTNEIQTLSFASPLLGISDGNNVDLSPLLSGYVTGSGTTNYLLKWSALTNATNSNLFDNNTYAGVIGRPWKFGEFTTAGLPTGVTGYTVYNTTTNGPAWYQGSRWAYGLESTFNRGTATRIPFFDANGQITESTDLIWDQSNKRLRLDNNSTSISATKLYFTNTTETPPIRMFFETKNVSSGSTTLRGGGSIVLGGYATLSKVNGNGYGAVGSNYYLDQTAGLRYVNSDVANGINFENNTWKFWNAASGTADGLLTMVTRAILASDGSLALAKTTAPVRTLDVTGEARITDLTTDAPTRIVGADSDGDLAAITVSTGLLISGGNLIATGASTWLKTELEASRDVDITGGASTDFRIRNNTRTQFDGKFKIGSDSSFVHDPAQDTTYLKVTVRVKSGSIILQNDVGDAYMTIQAQGAGNKESGIFMESRGAFGNVLYINGETLSTFGIYNFDKVGGGGLNMSVGESPGFTGMSSIGDFTIADSTSNSGNTSVRFKFDSRGEARFYDYGTGTKEAADLTKTQSNYIAGFATDGTVLDLERKRDTTIFLAADTDYNFSSAVTTAQIASRYNRIIIHMTITSGVGADKTTTLHTPDANLMQCEILIRGTDNTGTYDNEIAFGTNNAISSDGTNTSGYTLAQGQGLHIRVVYNGSAYKYIYY